MKTAISIPDDLFAKADQFAQRTGVPRSQVFSEALRDYLAKHAPDEVTEAMDRALAEIDQPVDEFIASAARRVFERVEW